MRCVVCDKELTVADQYVVIPLGPEETAKLKRGSAFPPMSNKQWFYHVVRAGTED